MEHTDTIVIRVSRDMKKYLAKIAKQEGKSVSEIARKAMEEYIVLMKKAEIEDIFA